MTGYFTCYIKSVQEKIAGTSKIVFCNFVYQIIIIFLYITGHTNLNYVIIFK